MQRIVRAIKLYDIFLLRWQWRGIRLPISKIRQRLLGLLVPDTPPNRAAMLRSGCLYAAYRSVATLEVRLGRVCPTQTNGIGIWMIGGGGVRGVSAAYPFGFMAQLAAAGHRGALAGDICAYGGEIAVGGVHIWSPYRLMVSKYIRGTPLACLFSFEGSAAVCEEVGCLYQCFERALFCLSPHRRAYGDGSRKERVGKKLSKQRQRE